MKVLIVPTNRPDQCRDFLAQWRGLHGADEVWIIEDAPERTFLPDADRHYCWADISRILGEDAWIISRRDSAIRCFGFFAAWHAGATSVLTLDDDCYPLEGHLPLMERHLASMSGFLRWQTSCNGLRVRGIPYKNLGKLPPTVAHVGLWAWMPDLDGKTQIQWEKEGRGYFHPPAGTALLAHGQYAPLCFPPGTDVTVGDGRRQVIERVAQGDMVIAGDGTRRRVLHTLQRHYEGDLVSVRTTGQCRQLITTADHSILVSRAVLRQKSWRGRQWVEDMPKTPQWLPAKEIRPGDWVVVPLVQSSKPVDEPSLSLCRLMGYFLAEGSYDKYSPNIGHGRAGETIGLTFTFSIDEVETLVKDCCRLLSSMDIGHHVQKNPKRHVAVITTHICDALVKRFLEELGEYCDGKHLPPGALDWSTASKRELLAAYWAGDGSFSAVQRGGCTQYQAQAKTRSRQMAMQLQLLLQSLGFSAATKRLPPHKLSRECWVICINGARSQQFRDFLEGSDPPPPGHEKHDKNRCDGKYHYYRVRSVAFASYSGPVHNLTVEDEHSYLAEGLVVKNCAMNLCIRREALPLFYFPLQGLDQPFKRFDDIWAGIIAKKVCDHLGWHISLGEPFIEHRRASDAQANLAKEAPGMEANETFWEVVDGIDTSNWGKDELAVVYDFGGALEQAGAGEYITRLGAALEVWARLFWQRPDGL